MLLALLLAALPLRPAADAARLPAEIGHGRPAVLHFFATWCGACREEFPRLRQVLLSLPDRDVGVALVSIDPPAKVRAVEKMLSRYRLRALPALLLDAPDPDQVAAALGEPKWDGTLPATFVFDARGKLVRSFIGRTTRPRLEAALREAR